MNDVVTRSVIIWHDTELVHTRVAAIHARQIILRVMSYRIWLTCAAVEEYGRIQFVWVVVVWIGIRTVGEFRVVFE